MTERRGPSGEPIPFVVSEIIKDRDRVVKERDELERVVEGLNNQIRFFERQRDDLQHQINRETEEVRKERNELAVNLGEKSDKLLHDYSLALKEISSLHDLVEAENIKLRAEIDHLRDEVERLKKELSAERLKDRTTLPVVVAIAPVEVLAQASLRKLSDHEGALRTDVVSGLEKVFPCTGSQAIEAAIQRAIELKFVEEKGQFLNPLDRLRAKNTNQQQLLSEIDVAGYPYIEEADRLRAQLARLEKAWPHKPSCRIAFYRATGWYSGPCNRDCEAEFRRVRDGK